MKFALQVFFVTFVPYYLLYFSCHNVKYYETQTKNIGEGAAEYCFLYRRLLSSPEQHWREYAAVKGLLSKAASLVTREIERLRLFEASAIPAVDLAQGFALKVRNILNVILIQI